MGEPGIQVRQAFGDLGNCQPVDYEFVNVIGGCRVEARCSGHAAQPAMPTQ